MSKFIDISKQKFNQLTAVKRLDNHQNGSAKWLCMCDCGKERVVVTYDLTSGRIKSCGCSRMKHGHSRDGNKSRTYISWAHMIQRCTNTNNQDYKMYGGRGIKIYEHWMRFECFLDDMGECPNGCSIDRIDNNGGYNPDNCRWATPQEQARNRKSNRILSHNNKIQCIAEWSREAEIPEYVIRQRLKRGWSISKNTHNTSW